MTGVKKLLLVAAGHEIHLFEPAAGVQAIGDVAQSIRTKTPVSRR